MDQSWDTLNPPLCKGIRKVLKTLGFDKMTPVQVNSFYKSVLYRPPDQYVSIIAHIKLIILSC